jgi:hypothetical protein
MLLVNPVFDAPLAARGDGLLLVVHPVLFVASSRTPVVLRQFGPDIGPIFTKVLSFHSPVRMCLDEYAQLAAKLLFGAAGFAHVTLGRFAARSEIRARWLFEAVEVCDELVHTSILPDGNRKSIPFGDLPLGNGQ